MKLKLFVVSNENALVTRGLVNLLVIVALLGCPYVCLAGAAGDAAAPRACCPRCQPANDAATPVPADDDCTACCLCKGAVLGDELPDLRPEGSQLLELPPAVEQASAQSESPFLLSRSLLPDLYGESLRIAIASWLC